MYVMAFALAVATMFATTVADAQVNTQAPKERDQWFTLSLGGTRCGWMHEATSVDGSVVETLNETSMTLGRAGSTTTMRLSWRFVESSPGVASVCEVLSDAGGEPTRTTYRFEKGELAVVQRTARGESVRREKLPADDWMTPSQVERFVDDARKAGTPSFSYTTLDPSGGMRPVTMRVAKGESRDGCSTYRSENTTLGLVSIEVVDANGALVSSTTALGLGELVARAATKAEATAAVRGASFDVVAQSLVALKAPQPQLARGTRAVLRVSTPEGAPTLPSAGGQLVATDPENRALLVTVQTQTTVPATEAERDNPAFLASTAMIDASDPAIEELARRARASVGLASTASPREVAMALRSFVASFIQEKGLATAFASASAVAASRAGDCTEHALLLAALLRAEKIPARVAGGLVYADEFAGRRHVFAWHMWTQALLDGAWVDLDATLTDRPFHPGHLLIAVSAQDEPSIDADFAGMLGTIGALSIEVVRVD